MLSVRKESDTRWKKPMPWSMSGMLTCCANTTKPMHGSKAKPGDGRSHEPADEKASWRSGLLLVTNGCSPSHESSGSMIWALLFDIWPRIFDKRIFRRQFYAFF